MQNLPTPEVYELEATYMPWDDLIREVLRQAKSTPQGGTVIDLMCGTGYLLSKLREKRPDLSLTGVDLELEYVDYAARTHPGIRFVEADARTWQETEKADLVLVTGGLHHLPYEDQEPFVRHLSSLVKEEGRVIVADPYIEPFDNEQERKLAAASLGYNYLYETIKNGAPDEVVRAAAQLIENDVCLVEFKTSVDVMEDVFKTYFHSVWKHRTWPRNSSRFSGDYCFTLMQPLA